MDVKLIAIDMDGTLLNSNNEISSRTKNALMKAKEKGVYVVLATGRILKSAQQYADAVGLDNPIIACNGAVIIDEKKHTIYERPMDKSLARQVMELGRSYSIYNHFYDSEKFYASELVDEVMAFYNQDDSDNKENELEVVVYDIEKAVSDKDLDIFKFIFIDDNEKDLRNLRRELEDLEGINVSSSWDNNIEVMGKGVSKGNSLEFLAKMYNISADNIIAIGDNENDLPMIEYAGLGVAMGNGAQEVLDQADFITSTNDEDGVAKVIEKFVLGIGDET